MPTKRIGPSLLRLLFHGLVLLPAEVLEIALGHVAGGFRDALHLDRVRGLLGGLLDFADQVGARFGLKRLTGGIAVEDLLALVVELLLVGGRRMTGPCLVDHRAGGPWRLLAGRRGLSGC